MRKTKLFGIVALTFLMISLAMSFAQCEGDGNVLVIVSSDSPTTVVVNGQIVPQIIRIKEHYNPIRLKREMRQLAEGLGETNYYLMLTMQNLNTTMYALNRTITEINAQDKALYNAYMKIGDLEANFNGNGIELKNFEKYTDEQLSILFDGLEALRSEITMELSALTTRIEDVETTTTRLEERQNTLRAHVATRDTLYTLGILACFAILGGIFVGVWTSRK